MSLQNTGESPFSTIGIEVWEKEMALIKKAEEITSPHENLSLKFRALKTIGQNRGLQTPIDNDPRFSVFSSKEEIKQELNDSLKNLGLQALLYEAMISLETKK